MKNSSKINLNEARDPRLREALLVVDECCLELGIDFYILGALARDVWFTKESVPALGTKDIDFAILVSEVEQFYQLKDRLIEKHGFEKVKTNEFVLLGLNQMQIDILPFGKLEVEDGVTVEGEGLNRIKVNGFKEVYLASVEKVYVLNDKQFKVATLPGIFLLKIIAFDDRPDQRPNDPEDCIRIIQHYFNLQSDLIYSHHSDLFGDDDLPLELISARVIGREMRKTLDQNEALRERTTQILKGHIAQREKSSFILRMASFVYLGTEDCVLYLEGVLKGITEDKVSQEHHG
jgi:predicted nucleotidyltransferase